MDGVAGGRFGNAKLSSPELLPAATTATGSGLQRHGAGTGAPDVAAACCPRPAVYTPDGSADLAGAVW